MSTECAAFVPHLNHRGFSDNRQFTWRLRVTKTRTGSRSCYFEIFYFVQQVRGRWCRIPAWLAVDSVRFSIFRTSSLSVPSASSLVDGRFCVIQAARRSVLSFFICRTGLLLVLSVFFFFFLQQIRSRFCVMQAARRSVLSDFFRSCQKPWYLRVVVERLRL